ncbi:GAP1-N2 domain-containing protein [Nocardioides sp. URHA0032]|uniref:GAP1-N2 domain-containing protein n=1 Tax=Nocardioides sp. URHA0032 TaxID=1380388 RepID=UPI00048AD9ED|nr:hypothetical protein [Nocardioides sp. URHA0032]
MSAEMSAETSWAQLTYVSMDRPGASRGGWGVGEVSPGAPADLVEVLRNGVTTSLEEVVATSPFATQAELDARPRRMLATEADDGATLMWHAASAGQDASGRPGNVFTHAAARRESAPATRPIDYWRSPDWLTPFGIGEVNSAKLGDLRPGDAVGRTQVVDFIMEGEHRFVAEWLLAAMAHAYASGTTLVLAVETPDEGARWIGVLCHLMPPAQARGIRWVTYERGAGIGRLLAGEHLDVVCVPREDLDEVMSTASPKLLALDPRWGLDDDGETWEAPGGQSWPDAPRWQDAMLDLFALDRASVVAVLETMDDITSGLTHAVAAGLPLHWGLSIAMLVTGSPVTDAERMRRECVETFPSELDAHPRLAEFVPVRHIDAGRPAARETSSDADSPTGVESGQGTRVPATAREAGSGAGGSEGTYQARASAWTDAAAGAPQRELDAPADADLAPDETASEANPPPARSPWSTRSPQEAPNPLTAAAESAAARREASTSRSPGPVHPKMTPTVPGPEAPVAAPTAAPTAAPLRPTVTRPTAGVAGAPVLRTSTPPGLGISEPAIARLAVQISDVVKKRTETENLLWHYHAMEEVLRDVMGVREDLTPASLDSLERETAQWVKVVTGLIVGKDAPLAAELVVAALNRDVDPRPAQSPLSFPVAPGRTLGWAGALRAWNALEHSTQDYIFEEKFSGYRGMPRDWSSRIEQLMYGGSDGRQPRT